MSKRPFRLETDLVYELEATCPRGKRDDMPVYLAKNRFLFFELVRVVQTEPSVKELLTFISEISTMLLDKLSPNVQVTLGLSYFWFLGIILIHCLDLLLLICLLHGGVHDD